MTALPAPGTTERFALPVGVIGAGRLGTALAGALAAAGYTRITIAARSELHAREAATSLGVEASTVPALVHESTLVFLAVPDRAIPELVGSLPWLPGQGAVHCSGAVGLDALAAAVERGAVPGCLHPLQTFPGLAVTGDREACAALFRGIACGVEAPPPLGDLLRGLANDLGARSIDLAGVDRALYHAAAVLVSNDVVALAAAAARAWALAGLPPGEAREALAPLLLASAANAARLPPAEALTGPVARGDVATVGRHLDALARDADLSAVYRALARELLRLDLGLAPEVRAALEALLRGT
ncbi:MAG: DUF2520 domain-containing protein [Dehalococcoidia bacterium]